MMPKRDLLHEWMHRFQTPSGVVRVWTQASSGYDQREFNEQNHDLKVLVADGSPVDRRLNLFLALGYVTAIEALDFSGNGRLVYVDWP